MGRHCRGVFEQHHNVATGIDVGTERFKTYRITLQRVSFAYLQITFDVSQYPPHIAITNAVAVRKNVIEVRE